MTYYDMRKAGFEVGMRVEVIRQHKYKKYKFTGLVGVVESNYGNGSITVKFDNLRNTASSRGVFYFEPADLKIIDENMEEKNMEKITNYLNAVKIQYLDSSTPNYIIYANFDAFLQVGDLCVVKSAHHGLGLAKVVEVIDRNDYEISSREIVARVDDADYKARVAARTKAAELKAKMEERAKQLQDVALYQMLAKDDSVMMELLEAYQALPKV